MEYPSAKRSKPSYKVCGHCHKELSEKIYKDHKRLYYDAVKKTWAEDNPEGDGSDSSSEFSSLDEFDISVDGSGESIKHQGPNDSDNSDFIWEEPLRCPEADGSNEGKHA